MTDRSILEKCKMTPQEIFEYKNRWKPMGYAVQVHSDLDVQCKSWCRGNLNRWEWSCDTYTDLYAHTFLFENDLHGKEFAKRFEKWIVNSINTLQLLVDPTPQGWMYGFPKAVPEDVWYLDGNVPHFKEEEFNINDWMVEQGYPEKLLEYNILRMWVQEKQPEYIYPGSDCQE